MTLIQRRLLGLVSTLVVGGGVVAVIAWQGARSEERQQQADSSKKVLTFADTNLAKQIELDTPAGTFVVVREGTAAGTASWQLTSPLAVRADGVVIDGLLKALANLKFKTALGESDKSQIADKKLFGLSPPRFRVVITTSHGRKETLLGGNKNSFNSTLYVQREGRDEVLLVPSDLQNHLDQTLFKLRDKSLLDVTLDQVVKFDIAPSGKPAYTLRRDGAAAWKLIAARELDADRDQVGAMFSGLYGASASAIVAEKADKAALAKVGLDKPKVTLTITVQQGAPKKVLFAESTRDGLKKFYATVVGAGPIIELPSSAAFDTLQSDPMAFRSLKLMTFANDAVATLELSGVGKTLVFSRTAKDGGDAWRMVLPVAMDADASTLSGLIYRLGNLKAKRIERENAAPADLREHGLDTPVLRVTLKKADGSALAALMFGKSAGEEQYVSADGGKRIDVVDAALANDFSLDVSAYKVIEPPAAK